MDTGQDDASPALCRDCLWHGAAINLIQARRCPACRSPRTVCHPELDSLTLAHLDCDAFYASVEKRDRPELRDEPVIVGGGTRGVVTTCCYVARISGVRSAMPMFKALKLCPQAVVISPEFSKYRTESKRIMELMRALTPLVQPLSLDEAWMDLSGTQRLHRAPAALTLARLQQRIETEIGLTVSIGLAPNKFLAKIASDLDKPRGFSVIGAAEAVTFLSSRPVSILPGVGPVLRRQLESRGYGLVGDLARADERTLLKQLGEQGLHLRRMALGRDSRRVNPAEDRKSISAETTFLHDLSDFDALRQHLATMCDRVARQARKAGLTGRVATLKLRDSQFRIITRRRTLSIATQTAHTLLETLSPLLQAEIGPTYRLIGAGLSDLAPAEDSGSDLFAQDEDRARRQESAMDALGAKFGPGTLVRGRSLKSDRNSPKKND